MGVGDDGRILLRCHRGCETENIIGRLGIKLADLFPPKQNGKAPKKEKRIVGTYSYFDETGTKLLYQVVRYDPKDFGMRVPKAGGGWTYSARNVRRVLYRLPQLVAADPSRPVLIPEGGKHVDRLIRLGFVATCNPNGAGKWCNGNYNESLRGRLVAVLVDNDDVGRKHGRQVATSVHEVAKGVKIVELPGLSPKGDIIDWLDAGGTAEQLVEIVRQTPAYEPTPEDLEPAIEIKTSTSISNCIVLDIDENGREQIQPLKMTDILSRVREVTDNWPRRVGPSLFVHDADRGVCWLETTPRLSGWLATKCGSVRWHRATGCVTKEEFHAELLRTATQYVAVEEFPHEPKIDGHYYACPDVEPGDGRALQGFIDFFPPETDIDRQLLTAIMATPLWGGLCGKRPAGLFTAPRGSGKGKSVLAMMIGRLYGGYIDASTTEDIGQIKQRLLSPEAAGRRVALLDNVKTTRFSWAELESIITTDVISGKKLYVGEGRRPNLLTWLITLNGASLSTPSTSTACRFKPTAPKRE